MIADREIDAQLARPSSSRASAAAASADATSVGAVMRRNVIRVTPELRLERLVSMLVEWEISGAPVVDRDGKPIGMVSKTDVLRATAAGGDSHELVVRDIMMPLSFSLTESASVAQAAALMAFEGVHRVVIVGMTGAVVGILSSLDVLRWVAQHSGYIVPE